LAGVCGALLLLVGAEALAEKAWVRSEIRLNIRTGPGTQFRIVGVIKTGDGVNILERGESWTKVSLKDDEGKQKVGWIPEGYLNPVPPPTIRLQQAEARVITLEEQLSKTEQETGKLRETNDLLNSQDGEQQTQIKQLTMENMELRAGARYPEWITGASIFAAGMVLGAWLRHNSARRQPSRIRL
jgi:SH3 domain protein